MTETEKPYDTKTPATGVTTVVWKGLEGSDCGQPFRLPPCSKKSVQLGSHDANDPGGSTTVFQGTNDLNPKNALWFTLSSKPDGSPVSRGTSEKFKQILEDPLWVRPSQKGGVSGNMDIILVCKVGA